MPTLGVAAAILFSVEYGFTLVDGILLGVMYLLTIIGVEAGLHRFFTHRSFTAGPGVTTLLAILGSMAAQGPIVFWVAIHRTTTRSPTRRRSAFTSPGATVASPGSAACGTVTWAGCSPSGGRTGAYVPDLLSNRLVMRLNQHYFTFVLLGLALPALLGWLVGGGWRGAAGGFLWGGLARIFILDHVTWGSTRSATPSGSRPHRTRDNSRNVAPRSCRSAGPGTTTTTPSPPWRTTASGSGNWISRACSSGCWTRGASCPTSATARTR